MLEKPYPPLYIINYQRFTYIKKFHITCSFLMLYFWLYPKYLLSLPSNTNHGGLNTVLQ